MNAKDSYNRLIDIIEEGVAASKNTQEILDSLLSEHLCDKRVLAEIFKFMTGIPAIKYISLRQMMKAYSCLVLENRSLDEAITYSGLENNSSFDKKFRSTFGLTPTDAKQIKDASLYQLPLTWEVITSGETTKEEISMETISSPVLKFGIAEDKLIRYNEAMELQALYGFTDRETEIAFDFSDRNHLSLRQSFEYISVATDSCASITSDSALTVEQWRACIDSDAAYLINRYAEQLLFVRLNSKLSLKRADYLVFLASQAGFASIREDGIEALLLFDKNMAKFFDYSEFIEAYKYFIRKNKGNVSSYPDLWEKYVEIISEGVPYKDAFGCAVSDLEEFEEMIADQEEYEKTKTFDELIVEYEQDMEESWRFDEESIKPWDYHEEDDYDTNYDDY